jgi:hypothetical protein
MLTERNELATLILEEKFRRGSSFFSLQGKRNAQPMPSLMFCSAVAALAIVALLGTGSDALATTLAFKAQLSGGGEAPRNDSPGRAELNATLDTDTNTLTWSVTYSGLTGAPIGAHFHGPVSWSGLTLEDDAPIQVGTPGNLASPFKGSATITELQAKDLKDGRWYFNIHTPKFPAGEIRGPVYRQ